MTIHSGLLPDSTNDSISFKRLDGAEFVSDDLHRRVINRNNRLRRLLELNAPDIIVRNEKRMLQEAVTRCSTTARRRPRHNRHQQAPAEVARRHDQGQAGALPPEPARQARRHSGRSVIVVGPQLRLHQCGLPKKMALELFKPFIFQSCSCAARPRPSRPPSAWWTRGSGGVDISRGDPRASGCCSTALRHCIELGIQAFEPLLVEGKAIQLHPRVHRLQRLGLDGDQMRCTYHCHFEASSKRARS